MALSKTGKAIATINRRADLILNLYGYDSEEYDLIRAQMSQYDTTINEKTGAVHIRNTAENRKEYRQLNAWSKRIKKRPVSVEKRRAAKKRTDQYDAKTEYQNETGRTLDDKTYHNWLATFNDYFSSCYELATMLGYGGDDALIQAEVLFNDKEYYNSVWNDFYRVGAFDDFKELAADYDADAFYNKYGVDIETGETITNPDFFD